MKSRLDAIGIGLSSLCLIHCLLAPILIVALPALLGSVLSNEWTHVLLLCAAAVICVGAFWRGLRCHGCIQPVLLGAFGLILMVAALMPWLPETGEILLTSVGAVILIAGHIINRRLQLQV